MIIHLSFLIIAFISFTYSQTNTFNKACGTSGSSCGQYQVCINNKCACDPVSNRFWAGEKHGCRICPNDYNRQPIRCYKYYSATKNHSEARADCRKNQADLFSWRDNDDENELLTASISQWGFSYQQVKHQFYTWSGGVVNHGGGSKEEYSIKWVDPKGPKIGHPEFDNFYKERYCNAIMLANYKGDPEPTRQTKNGETENCVTFVFLPQPNSRGGICIGDDYCSIKLPYICELTEQTLTVADQKPGTGGSVTEVSPGGSSSGKPPVNENSEKEEEEVEQTGGASALAENDNSALSKTTIYIIGGAVFIVIVGVVAFIIIRKRKQNTPTIAVSAKNSIASSTVSGTDMYEDA